MSGWVKLHRNILDNPVLQDGFSFLLFTRHLLLKAAHTTVTIERGGKEITLEPGQLLLSIRELANALNVHETLIRRKINLFQDRRILRRTSDALGSVVTICNWELYQETESERDALVTHLVTHQRRTSKKSSNKNARHLEESKNLTFLLNPTSESNPRIQNPMDNSVEIFEEKSSDVFLDFKSFWAKWRLKGAKRGSKKRAEMIYSGLIKSQKISHVGLCEAVSRLQDFYEQSATDVSKMLHPATWLHQERWNDELVLDQPQRKSNYAVSSAEDLAERFARNNGFGGIDGHAKKTSGIGQGNGQHASSQKQPRHGDRDDGGRLPEVPTEFDQGYD